MARPVAKRKHTPREKRLIEEMCKPNVKSVRDAAIKAGYAKSTASVKVYSMLEKVSISEAIRQRRRRAIAHANITNDEVLGSAVFNMFTSVRDLLDEKGSFNFEKACETGAIDVVKKHKETRKTTFDPATNQTQTTVIVEVELESPAAARKEVANYIDLEKAPLMRVKDLSDEDFARELYRRLVDKRGMSEKDALLGIKAEFPEMDVKLLTNGTVNNTKNS